MRFQKLAIKFSVTLTFASGWIVVNLVLSLQMLACLHTKLKCWTEWFIRTPLTSVITVMRTLVCWHYHLAQTTAVPKYIFTELHYLFEMQRMNAASCERPSSLTPVMFKQKQRYIFITKNTEFLIGFQSQCECVRLHHYISNIYFRKWTEMLLTRKVQL